MFTGLIEDVGTLASLSETTNGWKLSVHTVLPLDEIAEGDSVSINGACLTAENRQTARGMICFHALQETIERTNMRRLSPGDAVNLERALKAGDRLGGHIVSGHVDECVPVRSVMQVGKDLALTVELPHGLAETVIEKGSVAINGVSLTVASLNADSFSVRLIPETWKRTNLRYLHSGELVNLEVDIIGKYVKRLTDVHGGRGTRRDVTMSALEQAGFLP